VELSPAANGSKEPILLKNSIFGLIDEFPHRTGRSAFGGEGGGHIGIPPLTCQLFAPLERSYLISWHDGHLSENHHI
jgi:hypothetical protein